MRVRLLQNVAEWKRGEIASVGAEQGEKLIRTGYATVVSGDDVIKKVKESA